MKATCYVTLIAVVLVDLVWSAWEEVPMRKRLQKIGLKILLLIAAFGLGAFCKHGIYCSVQYDYNADMEIGWSNYMYNGLNEDTTGACSGEGLEIVRSFAGTDKNTRIQYEMEGIRKRIGDRGIWGTIRFWLRKQVMNFNDGTFSWYQEGYFQAWEYPLNIDSSWKEPLRAFLLAGRQQLYLVYDDQPGIMAFCTVGSHNRGRYAFCGRRRQQSADPNTGQKRTCLTGCVFLL